MGDPSVEGTEGPEVTKSWLDSGKDGLHKRGEVYLVDGGSVYRGRMVRVESSHSGGFSPEGTDGLNLVRRRDGDEGRYSDKLKEVS